MSVFDAQDFDGHEQVLFVNEPAHGLKAIIAIHNTSFGPSLGGCRMWPYENEAAAIRDVLRLSRGMTYKAVLANVRLGGGKSVIIGNSHTQKTAALMRAMGRWIDSLGGRYIVGEDIGTNPADMREIHCSTRYVSCMAPEDGGYGDPAPFTALGAFSAIRSGVAHRFKASALTGLRVAVQGVGNVGSRLCGLLHEAGAELTITDVHEPAARQVAERYGCRHVAPDAIFGVDVDVFAPCAMGSVLNDHTIPLLRAKVVAGAANNQLAEERHGRLLADRGVLYLPDYVANGGGLMSCAAEWYREDATQVESRVLGIYDTCNEILERATRSGLSTNEAADQIARERLATQ